MDVDVYMFTVLDQNMKMLTKRNSINLNVGVYLFIQT